MLPGVQADVSIDLRLPPRPENDGLFVAHCKLLSDAGTTLHRAHRPLMVPYRSFFSRTARNLVLLPFRFVGLASETEVVRAPLVAQHVESRGSPLAAVHVALVAAAPSSTPPLIHEAHIRVAVNTSASS